MSASRLASTAIKIPKRIPRGPTDILKALASTVKHVPSEPDQYLHDDPYLLPIRPIDRNFYTLAKLSGKSTAKFLLNKHPEMFHRDDAEPKVRSFMPPEEYREDMVFDEGDVKWCIENNDPVNAIIAYRTLEKADVKLTRDTLVDLFELLCYTNEERLQELVDHQKDYFSRVTERDLVNQTWNATGLVSKIFNEMKEDSDSPRIYSAMIAGLSKYNEHATARQVFEDFKELHPDKGLYACAYNGVIGSIPNLCSSNESAYKAIEEVIKHMEQHLVKPDLFVFNSLLTVYRRFNCDETTIRTALKLVNDMRALEIEPSLCTYQNVVDIICRTRLRGSFANLINQILDYIYASDDLIVVKDERDLNFLNQMMRSIVARLNNLPLANKVHRIYMKAPNMFTSAGSRQSYLDIYFRLIVTTERMEDIWKFYTANVPLNFRPAAETYDVLVEALDLYQADASIVKKVGEDIVDFRMSDRIKDDRLFKKDPDYIERLSQSTMNRRERVERQKELLRMED